MFLNLSLEKLSYLKEHWCNIHWVACRCECENASIVDRYIGPVGIRERRVLVKLPAQSLAVTLRRLKFSQQNATFRRSGKHLQLMQLKVIHLEVHVETLILLIEESIIQLNYNCVSNY
jgi:hypothetical protein